jgi:type II secretory pathway pseudopilin PulG
LVTLFSSKGDVILIRTQRGITLVELLAALTILSFIGILIWSVFFQGSTYSLKSSTKNALQQEANIVITNLIKIHQTSDQYQINSNGCKLTVTIIKNSIPQTKELSNSKFCISINLADTETGKVYSASDPIDPNNYDIHFILTISDLNDNENRVVEDGILYRLKDGGI